MIRFENNNGDFCLEEADKNSALYFPLGNEDGVMASITPTLHGDNKTGQNSFLMEPVSVEDLHSSLMGRNMWFVINDSIYWAANGNSPKQMLDRSMSSFESKQKETVKVRCGKLFHEVIRTNEEYGFSVSILNYVPLHVQAEVMKVTLKNNTAKDMKVEPTIAIPLYGRSADNMRDHRHVTSLLHRIETRSEGICVRPTLSFDERGHQMNKMTYGIYAMKDTDEFPDSFFPGLELFIGEGGNLITPKAIFDRKYRKNIQRKAGSKLEGFEAMGGLGFHEFVLSPGESTSFRILLSYNGHGLELLEKKVEEQAFDDMKEYWKEQTGIKISTADKEFDDWLKWVAVQPTLRRIFGCSFLPHHDYGRGGRGYRDLWQDSLALLLNSKESIRDSLTSYYGGVRIDGSNATIIGRRPGEFIADRNSIVRIWMDHGLWPFITTLLYINQTGDLEILLEENTYFKDAVICRGTQKDGLWNKETSVLRTRADEIYKGTILEHILVQNLTAFFDVGTHGFMRLLGGDWNDALDMAKEHGESVAFSAAYAGNLENLSNLLSDLEKKRNIPFVLIGEELFGLISKDGTQVESSEEKQEILKNYCLLCGSYVSGKKVKITCSDLSRDLASKAEQIKKQIRKSQWIADENQEAGWFNSYYDNHERKVEGIFGDEIRMMLTGQAFTIMSDTATDEQISMIVKAADKYLFDEKVGGYRLNTDFKELKMDMGRMFGFAYGNKENGSVFSHMAVMYSYALYKRGFAKEGFKVVKQLYLQAADFSKSRIYPGIPEYFNQNGRGMYSYLTGAASWYLHTVLTEMFGVKGYLGDLLFTPKLLSEQFDQEGKAAIQTFFAGREFKVEYINMSKLDIGDYEVEEILINSKKIDFEKEPLIARSVLEKLPEGNVHKIEILLA